MHALLAGRQALLLRKGGIHEKRFAVPGAGAAADPFLLFPTVAHAHAERVRPEHRDLLVAGAADVTDDAVVLRAAARPVAAVEVARSERIDELAPWHVWTTESVRADRLDFRPKHRLAVLVVQVLPLVEPLRLPRRAEYGGCRSWLDLPAAPLAPPRGTATPDLAELAEHIHRLVG